MQTIFTMHTNCFRCGGMRRAFVTFQPNAGKCFRCNGLLREVFSKPVGRIGEYYPGAEARTKSIREIAAALACVGEVPKVENGVKVSPLGYDYHSNGDVIRTLCSALSYAPADVRRRGWTAFGKKLAEKFPADHAERKAASARILAKYTGVPVESIEAWVYG